MLKTSKYMDEGKEDAVLKRISEDRHTKKTKGKIQSTCLSPRQTGLTNIGILGKTDLVMTKGGQQGHVDTTKKMEKVHRTQPLFRVPLEELFSGSSYLLDKPPVYRRYFLLRNSNVSNLYRETDRSLLHNWSSPPRVDIPVLPHRTTHTVLESLYRSCSPVIIRCLVIY